jgi:hypothetical protein
MLDALEGSTWRASQLHGHLRTNKGRVNLTPTPKIQRLSLRRSASDCGNPGLEIATPCCARFAMTRKDKEKQTGCQLRLRRNRSTQGKQGKRGRLFERGELRPRLFGRVHADARIKKSHRATIRTKSPLRSNRKNHINSSGASLRMAICSRSSRMCSPQYRSVLNHGKARGKAGSSQRLATQAQ